MVNSMLVVDYEHDKDNQTTKVTSANTAVTSKYDQLGRITHEEVTVDNNDFKTDQLKYYRKEQTPTRLVNHHVVRIKDEIIDTKYQYDQSDNIRLVESDEGVVKYQYDGFGRLIQEDNQALNKSSKYEYDTGGNITRVREYEYLTYDTLITEKNYIYPLTGFNDQLTKIITSSNGEKTVKSNTYDNLGRQTTYQGLDMKWSNTNGLVGVGNDITYHYNQKGIRIGKNVNGVLSKMCLVGNKVVEEKHGDDEIIYQYLGEKLNSICYNGIKYYYQLGVNGDVLGIYDDNGIKQASYTYDAWGNVTVTNHHESNIGDANKMRYRSYYYDTETNFYYLNSRYYDPKVGRFISPDRMEYLEPSEVNGLNLYAYCGSNPVMRIDPTGTLWSSFGRVMGNLGKIIGGALLGLLGLSIALLSLPASFLLGGGFGVQLGFSLAMYGGFVAASPFSKTINDDMERIGWNPFNSNEASVLGSGSVSFYKGVPVFRISARIRSGSFLGIFLSRSDENDGEGRDVVRHEWGHTIQQGIMGPIKYLTLIGLPSWQEWSNKDYYERPWEITADLFGGVETRSHTNADISRGWWYLAVSAMFGVFGYLFLIGEYK